MHNLPVSRSEWAKLSWKQAQSQVGRLLNHNGFMKLEEHRIGKGRADLVVINKKGGSAIIGVIEVKCYDRVTPRLQRSAKVQACRYISDLYHQHEQNMYWKRKNITYFIITVFTKDYPVKSVMLTNSERDRYLPNDIKNLKIFSSTPDGLLSLMDRNGLLKHKMDVLDDYF